MVDTGLVDLHSRSTWLIPLSLCLGCPGDGSSDGDPTGPSASSSSAGTTTTATTTASTTSGSTSVATSNGSTGPLDGSSTGMGSGGPPKLDVGTIPDTSDPPLIPTDIDVVLTADNAYAFGYGSENEMLSYFGGVTATLASQIFNCGDGPESYLVPAEDVAEYLYIVAYGDTATTQGVIGQFRRVADKPGGMDGDVLYTGDMDFEVCATGVDYNGGDPPPTLEVINQQITLCNSGMTDPTTTSGGWVDTVGTDIGALAVGETNQTPYAGGPQPGNEFPLVCQSLVDEEAQWMWFNWDPNNIVWPAQSPFIYPGGGGNPMHDFMIFRLASEAVPPPPAG